MKQSSRNSKHYGLRLAALYSLGLLIQSPLASAQSFSQQYDLRLDESADQAQVQSKRPNGSGIEAYILGPGDSVLVELQDIPEYSGIFSIGPDGTLYLPRLRSLSVEGLTVEELRRLLTQKFSEYIRDPQVFVSPAAYRPIRVYIGGEVQRPGYYYLTGQQGTIRAEQYPSKRQSISRNIATGQMNTSGALLDDSALIGPQIEGVRINSTLQLPTVFDALRTAGGVTPFSKLSEVTVTRKRPLSSGGSKMRAQLNFLELITEGNETQNIRLFDGDTINVARSPVELRDQIIKAGQTNLSPDFLKVYVTGRVREPGIKVLPQGATLNQAIASAGGQKFLRGQVEFVRFNRNGTTTKRKFFTNANNPTDSQKSCPNAWRYN